MNFPKKNLLRITLILLFLSALSAGLPPLAPLTVAESAQAGSATISPALSARLAGLANNIDVGMVIVAFNSSNGLREEHLNVLRAAGVTGGQTFPTLGMVAQPMTAGQVRALAANSAIRSLWSNDRLMYYMHQARVLGGVQKVQTDAAMTLRNGGMPVSGAGNFSVLVIDSGVDATLADLQFGTKVIQNVQTPVAAGTLPGFTPHVSIENVPNTDQTVGHGTHCAGIIGGTGLRSGGLYTGVAPGAKIIGAGLGAGIFVINGLAAWEWGLANQHRYNIRVVSNSYGGAGTFDPDDPITIASKMAHDRNIAVVFAAGNDGPTKDTYNTYAKAPWVIGVAAGSKEGDLADFSSRGVHRDIRLSNEDPNDDFNAPTITAPGTGRIYETNAGKFTAAIVSTRSTVNLTANGLDADTELPLAHIPFYTQISGTSMATPYISGVVALMLDADPTLSPDEIREILTSTATKMPGREEWEVGAGFVNAHAAVDKVFNRSKPYRNIQDAMYNALFGLEHPPLQNFHIDFTPEASGPASANARTFTVEPNINVLDVFATVDTIAGEGTGNLVGMRITSPSGANFSTAIDFPVIGTDKRQIVVQNPEPGTWTLEIRGARGLTAAPQASSPIQVAAPGPVDGNISQTRFILPVIADIQGHPEQTVIEAALKSRLIDTFPDGTFRPNATVTREDLARSLALNTSLRQTLGSTPKFTDVSSDLRLLAEYATARGSTNRDFDFTPTGMIAVSGTSFNPTGSVNRLDLVVALVKALGHDAAARALANTTVTSNGTALSDNAQIPGPLRGYVQIAINTGLFEVFPAEVREIAPGQFISIPGPRFEPATTVSRAALAGKLNTYRALFSTGG
ncbi:MAG TPA: S8 family serine peptidase [Pyrinomonadaceae bacterium]|nr:S8 family serine peptidase [Pyrinomonadaceae bacterium]